MGTDRRLREHQAASPLRLIVPEGGAADADPLPRPAPVSPLSAFAAVAHAAPATPRDVAVGAAPIVGAPVRRRLGTWAFSTDLSGKDAVPVAVPDVWSRRDVALADYRGPVRYARSVTAGGDHARVLLDGVDYVAAVWVDGQQVGIHEGGFTPVAVDIPTGRPVEVALVVDDPVEPALQRPDPLLAAKRKIKGVFEQHDSRPGGMPLGPTATELWSRRWGTGGLTGPAVLHETGQVRIDATFVTATPDELRLSWVLTNHGEATDVAIECAVGDDAGVTVQATLRPGANRVSLRLEVDGARVWSPDDPHTYRVATAVSVGGDRSDSDEVVTGFRSVAMATAGDGQYQLHLNGRRTYVRAANYIPGVWLPELRSDDVDTDLRLAKAAGLNSVGVHAHLCPPALDAADRLGVLIYQDFPLQWFYDPDGGPLVDGGPTFAEASAWLAAELAYRCHNHPSLVYWCAHNEPAYQLAEAFTSAALPELERIAQVMNAAPDEEPTDRERVAVLRHVDPSRPAAQASGLGMSRPDGDVHAYAGSLSGGSVTELGATAFLSEYGAWSANFSAAATVQAARGDWPPPPETEVEWAHETHLYATHCGYAGRPDRFETFADWCFAGQLWAGWHAKVATEIERLAKYRPSGGQRYHFFVDHWGGAGAGVVDRHRTTGPAYRGLAAANRPVVALAPIPAGGRVRPGASVRLPVVVVNDTHDDLGTVTLRWSLERLGPDDAFLVGRDDSVQRSALHDEMAPPDHCVVLPRGRGTSVAAGEYQVAVGPDARVDAGVVDWQADGAGPMALFLDLDGILGWTSFVVADGWRPTPGLTGPSRFTVSTEVEGPLRRRWTGAEVDPAAAPPDQYLLGSLPVDVFDDVHVAADGTVTSNPLPWPDPLHGRPLR